MGAGRARQGPAGQNRSGSVSPEGTAGLEKALPGQLFNIRPSVQPSFMKRHRSLLVLLGYLMVGVNESTLLRVNQGLDTFCRKERPEGRLIACTLGG